jgi:hypothetical protein
MRRLASTITSAVRPSRPGMATQAEVKSALSLVAIHGEQDAPAADAALSHSGPLLQGCG